MTNTMADSSDHRNGIDNHCEVQVALRIRPLNSEERQAGSTVCIEMTQAINQIRVFQSDRSPYCQYFRVDKHFIFDQLFPQDSDQEDVFEGVGMPMVTACMDGFNTCIFCYGMTGSGKTFSMTGSKVLVHAYSTQFLKEWTTERRKIPILIQKSLSPM